MQPYPRALHLVWPGHLHGTGCLSARAMDTGFPTVVWCLCFGPGCAWVWVSVTPPALVGVFGGCVWVRFVVSPLSSPLGFAVFAVGLWFRPAPHLSWLGFSDVRGCVRASPAPRRSRSWCAVWARVLGSGFRLRPASPWGGVGVCVCLCARPAWPPVPPCFGVRCGGMWFSLGCCRALRPLAGVLGRVCLRRRPACTPLFLGGVCCVGVCAGLGSRLRCVPRGWAVGVCVRSCAPLAPALPGGPPVARGCAGFAVGGVYPPPPLWFSFGGGALWCWSLVVPVLGLMVSVPPSLLIGAALLVVFFSSLRPRVVCVPFFRVSLLLVGRCPRLGVAGFAGWSTGAPFGGSCVVCCLGAAWASCGVGGRCGGCGLFWSSPPLFSFWRGGSACSSLCLPWPGASTGRHSVWWFCLCRVGGCARRLRVALG